MKKVIFVSFYIILCFVIMLIISCSLSVLSITFIIKIVYVCRFLIW